MKTVVDILERKLCLTGISRRIFDGGRPGQPEAPLVDNSSAPNTPATTTKTLGRTLAETNTKLHSDLVVFHNFGVHSSCKARYLHRRHVVVKLHRISSPAVPSSHLCIRERVVADRRVSA